jgi:hypothetical protein
MLIKLKLFGKLYQKLRRVAEEDYLAMKRADKTSTPPTKKTNGPIPVTDIRVLQL